MLQNIREGVRPLPFAQAIFHILNYYTMFTYQTTITREQLCDIFTTALEGGVNYWFDIPESFVQKVRELVPNDVTPYFGDKLFIAIVDHGLAVPVVDVEDPDEQIGELNVATFQERIQKCATEEPHLLAIEIPDASEADCIFQYLALGEVVYG